MNILIFNSGSSSLKFSLLEDTARNVRISGSINLVSAIPTLIIHENNTPPQSFAFKNNNLEPITEKILEYVSSRGSIEAVGHRVVHGGMTFHESVRIDNHVKNAIRELIPFAPLHNPAALEVIQAAERKLSDVPQFAVFDTSFYAKLPQIASVYPLPYEWFKDWGIRRYGFHGISHAWSVQRVTGLMDGALDLRIVSCHLGSGCSITASRGGKAVATSMGFTPMDGIMMGTRPGAIDPGIMLYVQRERNVSLEQLDEILNHRSGLAGVSGLSPDFQILEKAAQDGNERARLALGMFSAGIRSMIGAMAVSLGGLDALAFTGGIGEHSAALRNSVCQGLQCLDVALHADNNLAGRTDTNLAVSTTGVRIFIIEAREDLMIAEECRRLL